MIYEVYKDLTAPLHIWYHYKRRNCEGGENGKTAFSSRAQTEEQLYKMQILYNLGKEKTGMLLCIDIGNTSISFGTFEVSPNGQPKLIFSSEISSCERRSAVAISSVVPTLTDRIASAAQLFSGCSSRPYIIGPGIKTGFKIAIDDPASLGADIVSDCAAALDLFEPPITIFDAGTVNTVTVIDKERTVLGSIFTPGVRISAESLSQNAELIESVAIGTDVAPLIGKNTEEALKSGIINGNSAMLDGTIRNLREMLIDKNSDEKLALVSTGEYAEIILRNCRNKFTYDPALTLRGIAALYVRNRM